MTIEQWWNLLDPDTRRWLVENPGCAVLPRTVVNAVNRASIDPSSELLSADAHGECSLSPRDLEFIRQQAHISEAAGS
ncbi:hypothetical protein [Sinomonas sp. B1-1]|uniref:hypothetical protein n=1 Tax=Sinomonas sp. B1-1 TaxID=3141454 RepID=UPI003D276450